MTRSRANQARVNAARRAEEVIGAWEARGEDPGPYALRTRHGDVILERVTRHEEDGQAYVEVYAGGETAGGDPHFRVFAPPTLVEDPNGEIESGGRRFRKDPLAALAEVVAQHGGAHLPKRERRTQG